MESGKTQEDIPDTHLASDTMKGVPKRQAALNSYG